MTAIVLARIDGFHAVRKVRFEPGFDVSFKFRLLDPLRAPLGCRKINGIFLHRNGVSLKIKGCAKSRKPLKIEKAKNWWAQQDSNL